MQSEPSSASLKTAAQTAYIEAYDASCEVHAAACLLRKTRQRNGVRLILYLVAGGFAFTGAIVLIKPLVPAGDYNQTFKTGIADWISVAEYEALRKIMYYSVGCSSFMLWCMMFMNRLSLARLVHSQRRLALDFFASMIDLAVWVSLLRLVLLCSREKSLSPGVCGDEDANSQALCEVILGELWFRQKMGVICAEMVGVIHFILFVGLFPDTLFDSISAIRRKRPQLFQAVAWEDQNLYGDSCDLKSAPPAYSPYPTPLLTHPYEFALHLDESDEEAEQL